MRDRRNLISSNPATALRPRGRGTARQPSIAAMKTRLHAAGADVFRYPEPMRACNPGNRARNDRTRAGPIAELLSAAAARIDRRRKRLACRSIDSAQRQVPLAQRRDAEIHLHEDRGRRRCVSAGELYFRCADAAVPLATTSVPPR